MNIPDHISESLETIFWDKILKFFDADPDPGSGIFFTLDPGWKIFGPGYGINIRNTALQNIQVIVKKATRPDPVYCLATKKGTVPSNLFFALDLYGLCICFRVKLDCWWHLMQLLGENLPHHAVEVVQVPTVL
jgi:hypothetical protein